MIDKRKHFWFMRGEWYFEIEVYYGNLHIGRLEINEDKLARRNGDIWIANPNGAPHVMCYTIHDAYDAVVERWIGRRMTNGYPDSIREELVNLLTVDYYYGATDPKWVCRKSIEGGK